MIWMRYDTNPVLSTDINIIIDVLTYCLLLLFIYFSIKQFLSVSSLFGLSNDKTRFVPENSMKGPLLAKIVAEADRSCPLSYPNIVGTRCVHTLRTLKLHTIVHMYV
jgi:hypothetical protein